MCLLSVDKETFNFFTFTFVIYWSLTVNEQYRLRVFGNELFWRIFECNGAVEGSGY